MNKYWKTYILAGMNILMSVFTAFSQNWEITSESQLKENIEPLVATYFGGSANESSWGIALDEAGNVFVTGLTLSPDFPVAPGSTFTQAKGKGDAYILKFDRDLKTILASARIGGSEDDCAYSVISDKKGFIYVAGYTNSPDFPTTPSAYCRKYNGGAGDAFILKMDINLQTIVASTFLGGSGDENDWRSSAILLDKEGNLIIGGSTGSADFPTTTGAFSEKFNGGDKDVFLSKLDSGLNKLLASTYLGGDQEDQLSRGLNLDNRSDAIYIGGYTFSKNFPTAEKSLSKEITGELDGFVARVSSDLSMLEASSILNRGWIYCMMVHSSGDIYVGGHTGSGFPTTNGAFCEGPQVKSDMAFISRFNHDLSALKSSTYIPGTGQPNVGGEMISLNLIEKNNHDILSAGWVTQPDCPITPGTIDETLNGDNDLYLITFNPDLSEVVVATVIGGIAAERWNRSVADGKGNIYIGSYTLSKDFPTTKGSAFEHYNGGGNDGYVVRMNENLLTANPDVFQETAKSDEVKKIRTMLTKDHSLISHADRYQRTALHSAARYGALKAAKLLISEGADVNAADENGNTPIHLAIQFHHDDIAGLLVHHGADINRQNKAKASPLILATMYGDDAALKMLLNYQANIIKPDIQGNTPLHISSIYGLIDRTNLILKYNPDVNARNLAGKTPLHLAVAKGDNEGLINTLLSKGADLNVADTTGKNAILLSTSSRPGNTLLLLKNRADIRSQDKDGNTVLHYPLQIALMFRPYVKGSMEKLEMLIANGADPNLKNKNGKSAMDLANEIGDPELIKLLQNGKSAEN